MRILILDWNSYGNIEPAMKRRGHEVYKCIIDTHASGIKQNEQRDMVSNKISEVFGTQADVTGYVFSYNYYPWVSEICNQAQVYYVSWIYDSPYLDLYSYTVPNSYNRIFVFDYGVYSEFEAAGIETVYYLPLGIEPKTKENLISNSGGLYTSDVSFVGSLYNEPKHRLYDKFSALPQYDKGYLDAIIMAQKNIYGENLIESLLSDEIIAQMEKCYPTDPNPTSAMTPRQIYSQYVLYRQVTSLERMEVLNLLAAYFEKDKKLKLDLYTHEESLKIPNWNIHGPVDYYTQMPQIFAESKINLNITLRSIRTGIPLRALDIMAAGGFLLTNYQAEMAEYFVPGEDFDFYEDMNDLLYKVNYYLSNDEERMRIAASGQKKVIEEHNLDLRLDAIEKTL